MAPAPEIAGQWSDPPFQLLNVAAHATLLPNMKILYWGRRKNPKALEATSLHEHSTDTFLLDLATMKSTPTKNSPTRVSENGVKESVNLFCSAHALQPDGSVFVAGGHLFDGGGVNQACVYVPKDDTWVTKPLMNRGRWYPSVLPMPDGSTYCISGTFPDPIPGVTINRNPQIWNGNVWVAAPDAPEGLLDQYTRLHLDPKGRIFIAGTNDQSQTCDLQASSTTAVWTTDGPRREAIRKYACSVKYDPSNVIYIGGGEDPVNKVERINLSKDPFSKTDPPKWIRGPNMTFARQQHNATILPDGTVLVTGGTQGPGFNNLDTGNPVHIPELWNPQSPNGWTQMAEESVDRCYHSIALLLPDARVLSAGGGEYNPDILNGQKNKDSKPNNPKDSLTNAQLFSPPYLFIKGVRPTIVNAPSTITYNQTFDVTVNSGDSVAKISWLRLGSVTHCCNFNQSFMFLKFAQQTSQNTKITVTAPATGIEAPPGHYMLFLLSKEGKPSVAQIIRLDLSGTTATLASGISKRVASADHISVGYPKLDEKIISEQARPPVVVGVTPSCPHGLGPCWGGAHSALQRISDIEVVRPRPDSTDCVAFVYLKDDILPDIDAWRQQVAEVAAKSYRIRGIEMTLNGAVTLKKTGNISKAILAGTPTRPDVTLAPFEQESQVRSDARKGPHPITNDEAGAYERLIKALGDDTAPVTMQITGTLQKHDNNQLSFHVREFGSEIGVAA